MIVIIVIIIIILIIVTIIGIVIKFEKKLTEIEALIRRMHNVKLLVYDNNPLRLL